MIKTAETYHVPVLLKESVDGLNIQPGGIYVDAVSYTHLGRNSCSAGGRLERDDPPEPPASEPAAPSSYGQATAWLPAIIRQLSTSLSKMCIRDRIL